MTTTGVYGKTLYNSQVDCSNCQDFLNHKSTFKMNKSHKRKSSLNRSVKCGQDLKMRKGHFDPSGRSSVNSKLTTSGKKDRMPGRYWTCTEMKL